MDRGIFAAASGGVLNELRLQVVGNNLANASTVGYKASRLVSRQQEFADTLAGALSTPGSRAEGDQERTPGVVSVETITDFTPGPVSFTGNPMHVALREANHFFVVNTPQGEQYTRAGNFTMDSTGNLTTPDGMPLMGEGGPITIANGAPTISGNGTVMANGEVVGRLRAVEIEDVKQLTRQGDVRFTLGGGGQPAAIPASLVPQSVEMPNISVVDSMVEMIAANRSFEGYTKTIKTIDDLNERAIRNTRATG